MNLTTLIPALVSLIIFCGTVLGKHLDEMTVTQLVTALVTLIGAIIGIIYNHDKKDPSA